MPAEVIARAFEPFFATKDVGQGSGLGLSQVYEFASSTEGRSGITSEEGKGTTVSLLPPASPATDGPRKEQPSADREAQPNQKTILIVEDEPLLLLFAAQELKAIGYRVITATNAREALEVIGQGGHIDAMFSDIVMPGGMNGVQLTLEARRMRPGLKVLLTSGYADPGRHAGVPDDVGILGKPYLPAELVQRIGELTRGQGHMP